MSSTNDHSPTFGLDDARAFAQAAAWTSAETYKHFAPHEYTTRWACRARRIEDSFEQFVRLIESDAGYWRKWGSHRWRSLQLGDGRFYWLYWRPEPPHERTVINRWWLDAANPEIEQLSLEVE